MSDLRILDFDIENRPLSYWIPDRPTAEITAIAAGFVGSSRIDCWLLGPYSVEEILTKFLALYDKADMVTGHYIRRHDLPIINGALLELNLGVLGDKMTSDTKLDLVKKADIPATQEFLSDTMGIKSRKYHMTQTRWREANRLTEAGLAQTRKRVVGDVRQHQKLRLELVSRGLLKAPRMWRP